LIKKIPYFSLAVNVNANHNSWPLGLVSCSRNKLKYVGNPTTDHHGDYDQIICGSILWLFNVKIG
jgi:hypothetical protein